ncbi:dermonecrotic toxin domain-containing protein [Pseudomonas pergaminensis]|uniref:dermonecrotic toxin domain-containing protein n=1 Tax=Pseudomonas pergaminensis TaxID=2853159 RepID=UPI0034D6FBF0
MTTPPTIPTPQNGDSPNPTVALLTQLAIGPDFREVATVLLRQQLRERYPNLDIDPDTAMVVYPVWQVVEDQVLAAEPRYHSLTGILARQAITKEPCLFIEGEHFLTQQPLTVPPAHLPVRIGDIAYMLNLLAPVMLRGYQAQQLVFWNQSSAAGNGPHWHKLSSVLREFWNVQQVPGWSAEDCRLARQLFHAPDPASRPGLRACVVDIDWVQDDGSLSHYDGDLVAVLIGKEAGRDVILTHSLPPMYDKYASLEQLGQALPAKLGSPMHGKKIQWRLLEPEGNFFDQLACALIALQIKAIGSIDFSNGVTVSNDHAALAAPPSDGQETDANLEWFEQQLPDWLSQASTSDLNAYSRHLKDLAALHNQNAGKLYQDGIAPIRQYALDALKAEMLKAHPDAANLMLDKLEIVVQSLVVWGTFTVPGQVETSVFDLADLALQNLIALPLGTKTLREKNGRALPAWLTVTYLESLITRVNIGSTYPALIKRTLLDDAEESTRRQQLYTAHLRVQLPLLALQCKIRREAGIDERGYRYLSALMETDSSKRQVEGQPIVLRQLAFVPKRRTEATQDPVDNMFVIGPQDRHAGPCLLYRPLLDQPLTQYPTPTNLLYAIAQSASLRDSVLAWLPDTVRNDYNQYVFPGALPSPWTVAEFLVDPDKLWVMSGPIALGEQVVNDDIFATLFKANATALVTLADRQSVSNAEARWATFKHAGWLILNAALPFLGRGLSTAAWIWQVMDQLQQVVESVEHPEQQSPGTAIADLLLNLGMAVALHAVTRSAAQRQALQGARLKPQLPSVKPSAPVALTVEKLTDLTTDELPASAASPLYASGAINRTAPRLGTVLDRFKVAKPADLGDAISTEGLHLHLYPQGEHYYAPVGPRWFKVRVDENGTVMIVDPTQPDRIGPLLISNRRGEWFVDTRLRLRGGGPKHLIRRAEGLAKKRAEQLRKQLSEFEEAKKTGQTSLRLAREAMDTGPSSSLDANRTAYLQALEAHRDQYETALQQLKELNVHAPLPDYPQKALSYLKAQVELTSAGIREALTRFTPKLRTVLVQIEQQAASAHERNIEDARQMSALNRDMIQRLEYMHTRFGELHKLSKDGTRLISTTKGSLPAYQRDDLKALQVTLARNLCLTETTQTTEPAAWAGIDQLVDTADVSIQCLRDTLNESGGLRLDERIDTLSSLIEQFQILDERLQDFPDDFSEHVITDQIQALRRHLAEFGTRALSNLGLLSAERDRARSRPSPPPTPPKPQKKFIRTRYNGMLIGEPRLSATGDDTGLVDIRSPLTHKIVATYHEKSPGSWVERLRTPTSTPTPTPVDMQASVNQGQVLLDGLPTFLERMTKLASQVERTPIGIEYLFHQHIAQLEVIGAKIEEGLTQSNETESHPFSASKVNKALGDAVTDLYQRSNNQVLLMLKQRPPTVQALDWLKKHNAVKIKKTVSRRRLKSAMPTYLDEYTISQSETHEVLWYAHFHYSATWTHPRAYQYGRLKTVAEHALGAAADTPKGLSDTQKIAYYRSEVSQESARLLFFT